MELWWICGQQNWSYSATVPQRLFQSAKGTRTKTLIGQRDSKSPRNKSYQISFLNPNKCAFHKGKAISNIKVTCDIVLASNSIAASIIETDDRELKIILANQVIIETLFQKWRETGWVLDFDHEGHLIYLHLKLVKIAYFLVSQ